MIERLTRKPLRLLVGGFQKLRRIVWRVRRPVTFGVHAVALTRDRSLILVKLRYARGWRLPGGGRRETEDPQEAIIRELREEIGLIRYGSIRLAAELMDEPDFKRDTASLFVVSDVEYRPRWSLEIEEVTEAGLDKLPDDTAALTRRWISLLQDRID
ncbi:MAG: NUDIX domain-containing protein [Sphingosinicella sp.]|nr:NUDIX domain-containing protein [Sphingosinicella sp.]